MYFVVSFNHESEYLKSEALIIPLFILMIGWIKVLFFPNHAISLFQNGIQTCYHLITQIPVPIQFNLNSHAKFNKSSKFLRKKYWFFYTAPLPSMSGLMQILCSTIDPERDSSKFYIIQFGEKRTYRSNKLNDSQNNSKRSTLLFSIFALPVTKLNIVTRAINFTPIPKHYLQLF